MVTAGLLAVLQAAVYPFVHRQTVPIQPLDIPVHCIYGVGLPTEESYHYDVAKFDADPPPAPTKASTGDGDGTVNINSLQSCRQ